MTWVEGARRAGRDPVHSHYLTGGNLKALAAILDAPVEESTIAHPLVAREVLRKGSRALPAIEAGRRDGRLMRVVTGMRDPVARSLSLLSFFADFCGHTGGGLSARDGAKPEAVGEALARLWQAVLAQREPRGSFERLVWWMMGAYRDWFDKELGAVFGVDLFSAAFPHGRGAQRLDAAGVEVIAYRAEDMRSDAPAEPALRAQAASFLDQRDFAFRPINTADTRRSWPLYREVSERFRLPPDWLDEIYAAPAVRHFYSPEEIEAFKARWGE